MEMHDYSYLTLEECYYIFGNEVKIECDGDKKQLILSKEYN